MSLSRQMIRVYKALTAKQRAKMHFIALLRGAEVHPEVLDLIPQDQVADFDYYVRLVDFLIQVVAVQSCYEVEHAKALFYRQALLNTVDIASENRDTNEFEEDESSIRHRKILEASITDATVVALTNHYNLKATHDMVANKLGVLRVKNSPIVENFEETSRHLGMLYRMLNSRGTSVGLRSPERLQRQANGESWLRILRNRYQITLTPQALKLYR